MQILGNYNSTLSTFHYQQLVSLLQAAVQSGGYGGGGSFDQAALEALQIQAQKFSTLPKPSAGQLVSDETFNHPLSLLTAQFSALLNESTSFNAQLESLLAVLTKDTALIDQLLCEAALQKWVSTVPAMVGANQIMWDFGVGYGPIADPALIGLRTDPRTTAIYSSRPPLTTTIIAGEAVAFSGLAPASTVVNVPSTNLTWTYDSKDAQVEKLQQASWTKLTLLESKQLINYSATPTVIPSSSPFIVGGTSNLGSLPIFVQTTFTARRKQVTLSATNGTSYPLSAYVVETDMVRAFTGFGTSDQALLRQGTDYTVDEYGTFVPLTLTGTTSIYVIFAEEYPAYQCSIDQVNWSPVRMLDVDHPYSDAERDFLPIEFAIDSNGDPAMPITDELGVSTGLYIKLGSSAPGSGYLLQVYSTASPDTVGATAVLEVDFAKFGFMNVLRVTPFTTFPMLLKKIEIQGLTNNTRQIVWTGSVPINQTTAIRLDKILGDTPLVSTVFLTFYQPNFALKQQTVSAPDALQRDVMNQLQSILPFGTRNVAPPPAQVYTGAQYEFGVADVSGQYLMPVPGTFAAGPNRFEGCPEVIRFDADYSATAGDPVIIATSSPAPVDFYLCYQAFNAAGVVLDQNLSGVAITSGQCMIFPFTSGTNRSLVDHVDVYLKVIHRNQTTTVQRFMFQITAA